MNHIFTACLVAFAAAIGLSSLAEATTTRVFDPSTKGWIEFDPQKMRSDATRQPNRPDPKFDRTLVRFRTSEKPGTIIIDTDKKFLFYVLPDFQAIRYGVGVGREGFGWSGQVRVGRKSEWPTWTPPAEMIERDPTLVKFASGMPGGLDNPLGSRALYLYEGNKDSLYRIHGTNEPWSIGHNVSSGCIRMLNEDVEDLYERVGSGTPVFVIQNGAALF
jgi:lipoprotein-anchoring transpeptidase ErfK/SrfK